MDSSSLGCPRKENTSHSCHLRGAALFLECIKENLPQDLKETGSPLQVLVHSPGASGCCTLLQLLGLARAQD